jgi:[ribosomal protein S5]-alanine N-acetyltransferase
MIPILETARLILRPLELAGAPAVQELFPHWEIVRYMSTKIPWPYPAGGALQFLRDVALPAMERGEQWLWAIRLKGGPSHLIGVISLSTGKDEHRGFWLGLPWQGQGLITEACAVATGFWFDVLGRDSLKVSKAAANAASRRVSEKQGARLIAIEERDYVSGRLAAEVWELTREDWHSRREERS